MPNQLFCGDNLPIVCRHVCEASIDLVYLDPPFNSNTNYHTAESTRGKGDQVFLDTWRWDKDTAVQYESYIQHGSSGAKVLVALETHLGRSDMLAYLAMMAPRLEQMRRVLKPTGSIYLHCDPKASHYLRILMDAVFGAGNFQNEIAWAYKSGGATRRRFARKHDSLLFYAVDIDQCKFNTLKEKSYNRGYKPYRFANVAEFEDERGWYTMVNMKDVWHIDMVGRTSVQRVGYPTQKPEALLQRILQASSDEGDVVLDPFCGSGTTPVVAQKMGRRWIAVDLAHAAIAATDLRLRSAFGKQCEHETLSGAPLEVLPNQL